LSLLALEGVACIRGGRLLFENLDLRLEAGGAALVSGPNGAGKSSLLRLAAGLLPSAGGRITRTDSVGLADERLAFDPKLELGKALAFWARIDGTDVRRGIAAMGLESLESVPVRMLSAGQRKRASLARLVSSGAPLWLLDEPGDGLDADGQARLAAAMAAHRAAGGAILAASHQPIGLDDAEMVALG
jgi:heme exporter protein A